MTSSRADGNSGVIAELKWAATYQTNGTSRFVRAW
jgi:hypothetical protein